MLTPERAQELYTAWFAPWVRALDLRFERIAAGTAVARLPANDDLTRGPEDIVSGQATMAAIDTVMVMAVISSVGEEVRSTTVSQTTNFLHPLANADAMVEVAVVRSGRRLVYGNALMYAEGERAQPAATASIVYAILRP